MKTLLIALSIVLSSAVSANSCLVLVGDYTNCTTGDAEMDATLEITKDLKIEDAGNGLTLTENNNAVTFEYGKAAVSEFDLEGYKVKMSSLASCNKSALKIKNTIIDVGGASPEEVEMLKELIGSAPITYSVKGNTIKVKQLLDIEYTCTKK